MSSSPKQNNNSWKYYNTTSNNRIKLSTSGHMCNLYERQLLISVNIIINDLLSVS